MWLFGFCCCCCIFFHFSTRIFEINVKMMGSKTRGRDLWFEISWSFLLQRPFLYSIKFFPRNKLTKYINASNTVFMSQNLAKFIIASMIKPSCKYLGRVGNKTSCPKLGAYCRLFYAKKQRQLLKGKPDSNFLEDFFTVHWSDSAHSDCKPLCLSRCLMTLWNNWGEVASAS